MSIFAYRKPAKAVPSRDLLETLKTMVASLQSEKQESPQLAELKRILSDRIAELEHKSAKPL